MKRNKHLEEIRKEITPETREKVRQFADDKIEKMSKEEQLDKLLKLEKELTLMFDSDVRVALALLEEIRKLNQNKDGEKYN
jgi:hypothetical protein